MFTIHLVQAPWLWGMSPIDNAPSGMLPHINCSTRKQHQQLWRIITGRKKSTGWLCVRATHGGAHCGSFPTERATRAGKSTIYTVIPHRASLRWEFRILVSFISNKSAVTYIWYRESSGCWYRTEHANGTWNFLRFENSHDSRLLEKVQGKVSKTIVFADGLVRFFVSTLYSKTGKSVRTIPFRGLGKIFGHLSLDWQRGVYTRVDKDEFTFSTQISLITALPEGHLESQSKQALLTM